MAFPTFGGGTIQPGQVSYAAVTMTANLTMAWPTFTPTTGTVVAVILDVTASVGSLTLSMPPANQTGTGTAILIRNPGSNTFTVADNGGNTIASIAAGVAKYIYISDNSTVNGVWVTTTFGTGTSAADAASLVGNGIKAIGATLNQKHDVLETTSNVTIDITHRAKTVVWTSGTLACTLPTAASMGSDFFFIAKNAGSGTITVGISGADTIDGAATLSLAPNDSAIIYSGGSSAKWYSAGYGRAVSFAFTQLTKSVAGAADVTLTASEAANKVMAFTGALTGNINVIVPNTVSVYYVFNNTTGAFTLTLKTAAGTGYSLPQGAHDVTKSDAVNVYRAVTNTAAVTAFVFGSVSGPSITFVGDTSTGFYHPGTSQLGTTNNGVQSMQWETVVTGVNFWDVFPSATTLPIILTAAGADTNISIALRGKGTGTVRLQDGTDPTKQAAFSMTGITTGTVRTYTLPDATGTFLISTSATVLDANLTIQDDGDVTKQAKFQASSITTGTTRTYTFPDANVVLVGDTNTQTLTNKTLTAPVLTSPKMTVQTLTPGATVAVDMSLGTAMTLTLGAAANALQAPSNLAAGQWGWITLKQDATGTRAVAWNAAFKFVGGVAPIGAATGLSTAANAVDRVYWVCDDGSTVQCTFGKGFA